MEMSKSSKLIIIVIAIASLFIITYYGEVSIIDIKIGYIGTKTGNEMTYKYRLFNGIEQQSMYLDGNHTLEITYESKTTTGSLDLIIKDTENNVILSQEMETEIEISIMIPSTGYYRLIIQGSWTSGQYALSWNQK